MRLWNRLVVVQFNDIEYRNRPDGFRIDAKVTLRRGQLPEANISIYNPSKETVAAIIGAKRKDLRIRVLAGYSDNDEDTPPLLFDGNIIRNGAKLEWSGPDSILTVQAKEGAIFFDKKVKIKPLTPAEKLARGLTDAASIVGQFLEQTTEVSVDSWLEAAASNGPTDAVRASKVIVDRILASERGQDAIRAITPLPVKTQQQAYQDLKNAVIVTGKVVPRIVQQEVRNSGLAIGLVAAADALKIPVPDGMRFTGNGLGIKQIIEDTFGLNISPNRGFIEVFERRKPRILEGPLFSWELGNLLEAPKPHQLGSGGSQGSKAGIEIKALLTPELIAGDRFELRTRDGLGDGVYVCTEHEMTAMDGYSNEFYSVIKGRLDP